MSNIIKVNGGNGSGRVIKLITKSIYANGTYQATSDNADGYSEVTVNVNSGMITLDLTPITVTINQGE